MSSGFVCLMGMGIVFTGLICIVLICKIMSFFVTKFTKSAQEPAVPVSAAPPMAAALPAAEKRAVIAGICACIAEDLGTDVNNIRVLSFKKVG